MTAAFDHLVVLAVGGRPVLVRTNCPRFARAAADSFADLTGPVAADEPTVVFQVERLVGADPADPAHPAHTGEQWAVHRDGAPCELTLRTDHVLVHLQWELNRLVIEAHPASVHAAAVLTGRGAVLLAGQSHSGKTTMAGWLVAHHGLPPLADEVVVLDHRGRAMPYLRPLGVRSESPLARSLPFIETEFTAGEQLLPMRRLAGRLPRWPAEIAAVVFPRRDEHAGAPVVSVVSPAEALVRLTAGTPGLRRHGGAVFHRLAALSRDAPALDVHYADIAAAAPAVLTALAALGCA